MCNLCVVGDQFSLVYVPNALSTASLQSRSRKSVALEAAEQAPSIAGKKRSCCNSVNTPVVQAAFIRSNLSSDSQWTNSRIPDSSLPVRAPEVLTALEACRLFQPVTSNQECLLSSSSKIGPFPEEGTTPVQTELWRPHYSACSSSALTGPK